MCKAALPKSVSKFEANIIFILNVFIPGVGTMIASVVGSGCRCDTFFVGLAQLATAPLIIGWIWAIWWAAALCGQAGRTRDIDEHSREAQSESHSKKGHKSSSSKHHTEHNRRHSHEHTPVQAGSPAHDTAPPFPGPPPQAYHPPQYPSNSYPPTSPP